LLALHRYAAENDRPIPRFLIIDQPTQVYFPSEVVYERAGGSVERTVTIPAGKALFLPIYNVVEINAPQLGDPPWSAARELELRQLAADSIESVTDLSADIDGRPVVDLASYRVQDDGPFNIDLPDNNVFDVPADTYGPSVSDGYFLMLAPLPAGKHTIHFSSTAGGVTQEVTYYLSVK